MTKKKDKCCISIIDSTSSIIPNPICTPDCLPNVGCDVSTFTSCVSYNGSDLICLGVNTGDSISTILGILEVKCAIWNSNISGSCKVACSVDDTCCGYLEDKIVSNTLDVSTSTGSSCLQLKIEEKAWVWVGANLGVGWTTIGGNVPIAYGKKNDEIRLRGQSRYTLAVNTGTVFNAPFLLPLSAAPTEKKVYSYVSGGTTVLNITINTNGTIIVLCLYTANPSSSNDISWDFINYVK